MCVCVWLQIRFRIFTSSHLEIPVLPLNLNKDLKTTRENMNDSVEGILEARKITRSIRDTQYSDIIVALQRHALSLHNRASHGAAWYDLKKRRGERYQKRDRELYETSASVWQLRHILNPRKQTTELADHYRAVTNLNWHSFQKFFLSTVGNNFKGTDVLFISFSLRIYYNVL